MAGGEFVIIMAGGDTNRGYDDFPTNRLSPTFSYHYTPPSFSNTVFDKRIANLPPGPVLHGGPVVTAIRL